MRKKICIGICLSALTIIIILAVFLVVYELLFGLIRLPAYPGGIAAIGAGFIFLIILIGLQASKVVSKKIYEQVNSIGSDADVDKLDDLSALVYEKIKPVKALEVKIKEMAGQTEADRIIYEHLSNGYILLDNSGVVIIANKFARDLFKADDTCVGGNINALTSNEVFLERINAAQMGYGSQMNMVDDKTYRAAFIPSAEKGVLILISDITEKQLAKKNRKEFSETVSSELNTPLSYISGFAEHIAGGQASEEDVNHFATRIYEESQRMISMIENVLYLSRLDEMGSREDFISFDITQTASEVITGLRPNTEAMGITVSLANTPCIVKGNKDLIHAMFRQLLSNAIRYNRTNGKVTIAVSKRDRFAYITISDTGIGIPKEEHVKVFERFYRVKDRDVKDGAGLGLAIVKQIVRYHNGSVDLESGMGEGTRVFIRLPQESLVDSTVKKPAEDTDSDNFKIEALRKEIEAEEVNKTEV